MSKSHLCFTTLLDNIEAADLNIPLKDSTGTGNLYRQAILKVTSVKSPQNLPWWKHFLIKSTLWVYNKLFPNPIEYTKEVPIIDDMYPFVTFLKENCGYSYPHALVIAASTCSACIEYINLELKKDLFTIKSMTCYADLDPECPICKLRKKAFFNRMKA